MSIILLSSILIMIASLSGVIFVSKASRDFLIQNLDFLTSFSAGVFLVVAIGVLAEVLKHPGKLTGLLWVLIGMFAVWFIFKLLPHDHDNLELLTGKKMLLSDAAHNISDGVLLVVAYSTSITFGLVATFGIFIHEFLQEISEFFVLKKAGYSTKKALLYNFLVSATILIGSIGGYFLIETFEFLELPLLAFSAGGFLIVVFGDLIPHSLHKTKETKQMKYILATFFGILLMFGANLLLADFHSHDHGSHADHTEHTGHEDDHHHEGHQETEHSH